MTDTNNKEIIEAIQDLASQMDERFNRVDERFKGVDERFKELDEHLEQMDERNGLRFAQLEKTLEEQMGDLRKDITLQFDGVYKRLDLANERVDRLFIAVDGFIVLHKKIEQEFGALRSKYERLEERIVRLETKFAM